MERVEEYIWGSVDEMEYLRGVVANDSLNSEQLLAKVEAIQRNLNVQLRQGVEANYPRLLEQVSAIEALDAMQAHFDDEMQRVSRRAEQLAGLFADSYDELRGDVTAIRHLTALNRILVDGLRCDELVRSWSEERELLRRAEIVHELNALLKSNEKLRRVKWLTDGGADGGGALSRVDELRAKTRSQTIARLKEALASLNCSEVSTCLKALCLLLHDDAGFAAASTDAIQLKQTHSPVQKELNDIMMESVRELDALFNQLCATASPSTGSARGLAGGEKCATKLLPQLGNRLHSYLEQYQLLGVENAQTFARHVGKIISARGKSILNSAWLALRLLQTVYKCLLTHPDSVARLIRDALAPLKVSILSQSLSTLFAAVDAAFAPQDADERKGALIVEKLNSAMRAELQSVNWDADLQREMESNVAKTLRYIGTKVEQQIQINAENLQLSGRVNRQQAANYQMLSVAHNFIKHWPQTHLSYGLAAIIEPSTDALLATMRSTVSLVLASMHSEPMGEPLAATATSSLYMKELCNHLKVFRVHVAQIEPLMESVDALPNFLNFVIEQLLLHASLIRPLGRNSAERFVKDLEYLCRAGLQPFNCKAAKLLNGYATLADFLRRCAAVSALPPSSQHDDDGSDGEFAAFQRYVRHIGGDSGSSGGGGGVVPGWLIVHSLLNVCGAEIPLPHESAGWTLAAYVEWFNGHADVDRFKFFRNLLASYRQAVVARGATEFAPLYPLINEIVERHLPQ